jgi:hypothetical protein
LPTDSENALFCARNAGLLALFLIINTDTFAQAPTKPQPPPNPSVEQGGPTALSPERQRGLRLLKTAEAEAAGLAPDMRAFVLWRASYAYTVLDPKKAESVAKDSFLATEAIEDPPDNDHCGPVGSAGDIKSWIQQRVLFDMIKKERIAETEEMLPRATEPVRGQVTEELVKHYISKKDLGRAQGLLSQMADSERYPFGVAADLLLAMGPDLSADRMTIFSQALNNFEQYPQKTEIGPYDWGSFVERTWDHVPAGVVLEAIDKSLEAAKSKQSHDRISMATDKGIVALNSAYELRLFQLLPVLEQLDKDKAESLLRDNAATREHLAKYPKGMQSLNAQGMSFSYGITDDESPQASQPASQEQARMQMAQQMTKRVNEVITEGEKNPQQAVNDALMLPVEDVSQNLQNSSPRGNALLAISRNIQKTRPTLAKAALDEIMKFEDQLTPAEVKSLADLPKLYYELGDADSAKKALKAMLKAAEKLYARDTDAEDPNKAFKGTWPSTDFWRQCVQIAGKISPALAEEIIAGIPDQEVGASLKVAFASGLLGAIPAPLIVSDCRKAGSSYMFSN